MKNLKQFKNFKFLYINEFNRNLFYKISRNFSSLRNFKGMTVIDNIKKDEITKTNDLNLKIKTPMEAMVGLVTACSAHSIMYYAKVNNIQIEKIEINAEADFDVEVYIGKKEGKNIYEKLNLEANIYSSEKDKEKLMNVVEKGEEKCPLLETLKLAGVKVEVKINYL